MTTLSKNDTQHNNKNATPSITTLSIKTLSITYTCVMPSVVYAECPTFHIVILCHNAQCHYTACHLLNAIMLSVIMLSVVMLSVVILSIVAPSL